MNAHGATGGIENGSEGEGSRRHETRTEAQTTAARSRAMIKAKKKCPKNMMTLQTKITGQYASLTTRADFKRNGVDRVFERTAPFTPLFFRKRRQWFSIRM